MALTYLLPDSESGRDSLIVHKFLPNGPAPLAPTPFTGTAVVVGSYSEIDLAAETADKTISLPDTSLTPPGAFEGDRVAFFFKDLGKFGLTLSDPGGYSFKVNKDRVNEMLVLEYSGSTWVEVV
jgi:hypothetical protein